MSTSRKILIATGVYPPESGGPATYTKLLEERLPVLGFELEVLPFRTVRHLPKIFRHIVYFLKCLSLARRADIVYAQDTVSVGLPAALAALALDKKFVVRVPGDYAWEQGGIRFGVTESIEEFQKTRHGFFVGSLRAIQKFVVKRAARIIVPSKYMREIVTKWLGENKKIQVIYSSVELPVPYEKPVERPGGFLITTIARLVPWKGIDGIIRIIAREKNWHLVVVGDGPEASHLEELAKELNVTDRVLFRGLLPRAKALGWAKVSDAFVLNSTYEGLSHVLIEVMSLGIPVVATSVGGNPEVVQTLLVAVGNEEALHNNLKWIEDNKEEAIRLGKQGAQYTTNFSIDETIGALAGLLKRV